MCGIALVLDAATACPGADCAAADCATTCARFGEAFERELVQKLHQRGPDHVAKRTIALPVPNASTPATAPTRAFDVHAAVLHLRGDALFPQPVADTHGNVLCWNGEVFGTTTACDGADGGHYTLDEHASDTKYLSDTLAHVAASSEGGSNGTAQEQRVLETLFAIHGPFAFVWVHTAAQRVYFGHDRFGRRSLLYHCADSRGASQSVLADIAATAPSSTAVRVPHDALARLCLSSVAITAPDASGRAIAFQEVPSNGVFVLDFAASGSDDGASRTYSLAFHPYPSFNAVGVRVRTIPAAPAPSDANSAPPARVAVLFSGGLDSVVLAALAHFHAPPLEPIDLLNVCFDAASNFQSPDRVAAELSLHELETLFPARTWRFVRVDVPFADAVVEQRTVAALMAPCETHMDFNIATAFWFLARGQGRVSARNRAVASGVVLADLNAFLETGKAPETRAIEIALRALALFDTQRTGSTDPIETGTCPVAVCRRKLKPGCVFQICRLCCLKVQKLLTKALSDKTHAAERAKSAQSLVAMGLVSSDDALAEVLAVFAAATSAPACSVHRQRTSQYQRQHVQPDGSDASLTEPAPSAPAPLQPRDSAVAAPATTTTPFTSIARVLLVGIGADEQLGGYGRHKTAFETGGVERLRAELAMDMARIWKRNLGRDDRCLAAHGKEARFPFLDERVVAFVQSLPTESICDFTQPRGVGDKRILRVAAQQLGLRNCTGLAKRAIQFGTRIAKHSNVLAFGSNRQATGGAKFHVE